METDGSYTGNSNNVFFRDARDGHSFSYLMQTDGRNDLSLRLKYWGVGEWKTHEFDIFVDDVLVRSVNNTGKYRISEFKYETYEPGACQVCCRQRSPDRRNLRSASCSSRE